MQIVLRTNFRLRGRVTILFIGLLELSVSFVCRSLLCFADEVLPRTRYAGMTLYIVDLDTPTILATVVTEAPTSWAPTISPLSNPLVRSFRHQDTLNALVQDLEVVNEAITKKKWWVLLHIATYIAALQVTSRSVVSTLFCPTLISNIRG